MSCHSPWACRVLLRNQLITIWEFTCMLFIMFPLLLFFFPFNYYVSWHVLPWVYSAWDSLSFLDLGDCILSYVRDVFSYYLFRYFLRFILSLFSFWDPYNVNVGAFNVVQRSLRLSSFLFILIFSFPWQWFPPFCLPCPLSVLLQLFSCRFLLVYFLFHLLYLSPFVL